MDTNEVGSRIENARNKPKYEDSMGEDMESLDEFDFDSLDTTNLGTGADGDNIENYANSDGSTQQGFGGFNQGDVLAPPVQQAQQNTTDWSSELGNALLESSKSSFKIFISIFKSLKNRIADDWATFCTRFLYCNAILFGVSLLVFGVSFILGKPIKFTGLPLSTFISLGLSFGTALIVLSGLAGVVLRTNDRNSKLGLDSLSENQDGVGTDSLFSDYNGSSYDDYEDDDSDIDDIMRQLNGEVDDGDDYEPNSFFSSQQEPSSYTKPEDVFLSMLEKHSSVKDISETVPSNVPLINRAYLVDLFKPYLMISIPDFSKEEHIESGSERFKDAETLLLSAYASGAGKNQEDVSTSVYLDSMVETLFSYTFMLKRSNTIRITIDKLRDEVESYFRSDVVDPTNPDAGTVSADIVKVKDYFRISVTKPNLNAIVSLGDCLQRKDIVDFFKDTKNILPIVAGITDNGTPVTDDIKKYDSVMIAGKQRSGKSWYVTSLVMQLQLFNTPEDVQFLYIDPKETYLFKSLSTMPHCCGLHSHHRILDIMDDIIKKEAPRRKKLLLDNGCDTIWALRDKGIRLPVLYIVIDEYLTIDGYLGDSIKELQSQMREIMSQYPYLGIRLLFIPHRAQGVVEKTARQLISYACAVKTEKEVIEETLSTTGWTRKLTMPGDIAMRLGSNVLYVRGAALESSDEKTTEFIRQIAKSFYKMGVEIPDMTSIGCGYNRNEEKIREDLEFSGVNKLQYDANRLNEELDNIF